ncbi:MAG: hypothetical protein J6U93_04940 [Alistipes sp.]|nr:hypothetical protein [Alistipes sp.]MBO7263850.1 hypothetical protein [Alistipes sp.]
MRRLTYFLLISFLLFVNTSFAQNISVSAVLRDTHQETYVWAIGYGKTLEEADGDAMNTLASYSTNITSVETLATKNVNSSEGSHYEQAYSGNSSSISNMYLENVRREVLSDEKGMKRVLRYMTREDWEARNDVLRGKIEEYIESGKYATMVEDKIRYYSWANILLQTYPENEEPIMVDGTTYAKHWLISELRNILNNIEIYVIGIEQDKTNTHYPYKVFLDFLYQGEPISYICYGYFDGRGYVDKESAKDGRGVVQIKDVSANLTIDIECLNKDLARQLDPSVFVLIENQMYASSFDEARKSINLNETGVKRQKSVNTLSTSVNSKVNEGLQEIADTYVEVSDAVSNTKMVEQMMNDITAFIQKKSGRDIRPYFSDEAWVQYEKIVTNGKPIIARTPEYKFIKHDTLTICQSIPLKLSFSGNRSFVEDVVFRVDNKSHKIESVAYKLSAKTEQEIMSMSWDDAARLTLIAFLEDYRTAYCLKNIDYINKVFADDAYIIVGRVLQQSTRKFSDSAHYAFNSTNVAYSKQTKQQYVSNLRKSFASKEFVNIRFEECNVAKGYYAKEGIYAVQVKQMYYSNNYADEGILTLAIDMREDTNPLVRVRVWQAERDVAYNAEEMIERTVSVDGSLN